MSIRQMWQSSGEQRRWWVLGGVGAFLVVAVFLYGLVNMVGAAWRLAFPPHTTSVLATISAHDNDAGLVALFAQDCVQRLLTTTPDTASNLSSCFTLPAQLKGDGDTAAFPSTAATVTDVRAYTPQLVSQDAELSTWSVLVAASVKQFSAPAAVREYVLLPVSLPRTGGPRAMQLPYVRASSLPAGVDLELAYTHKVADSSALYDVVNGFLTGYLGGSAEDVRKYVTAESGLTALAPLYSSVQILSMDATAAVDGPPAPGQQVDVLATVVATTADGGRTPFQYPLRLADAAGRWAVAALTDVPATTGRVLTPGR